MPRKIPLADWLASLKPSELDWACNYFMEHGCRTPNSSEPREKQIAMLSRQIERHEHSEKLLAGAKNALRQTRWKNGGTGRKARTFNLETDEATALKLMAEEAGVSETEVVRRLLHDALAANEKLTNKISIYQRAIAKKDRQRKDQEQLIKLAGLMGRECAMGLGLAFSILVHRKIQWEDLSPSEIQLGIAYAVGLWQAGEKRLKSKEGFQKRRISRLERAIDRPSRNR